MVELKTIWGVLLFAVLLALGSSKKFESQVCFETAVKFGFSQDACKFRENDILYWFSDSTEGFSCKTQCTLSTYVYKYSYRRASSVLFFANNVILLNLDNFWRQCSESLRGVQVKVHCPSTVYQDYFGPLCTNNTDCWRPGTFCSRFGEVGVCLCDDGFVRVNGDCKTAGLDFDKRCDVDDQCTGSDHFGICSLNECGCHFDDYTNNSYCYPRQTENVMCIYDEQCSRLNENSCCNNTTCTCCPGYELQNGHCEEVVGLTTEYQVSTTNPETQQILQDSESGQEGSSAGTVAGVGLGGFVFGVVVSLSVVFIMRKRDSPRKQFSESRNTAVNFSYETQTERIESHQDRDVSNTKQVSHVRPTIRDTPYSNVKCFSENDNGDIYNHLHEKEDPGADLDDYDHAHPSNEHGVPDEDYSHLSSQPERGMESQQNDDVYDRATSIDDHDNYFTLERKSDLS